MSSDVSLYAVLDYILNQATTEELQVITEALNRRQRPGKGFGGLSPRDMAAGMARNISEQLAGTLDIRQISRRIVGDLVKKQQPGMGEEELEALLDAWLPEKKVRPSEPASVPPDMLVTMVAQFVASEKGALSEADTRQLPPEWKSRYWEAFPPDVRTLIKAHLAGGLPEVDFWKRIVSQLEG
jgi:hypothetical protein